jgi:hypothetical protein
LPTVTYIHTYTALSRPCPPVLLSAMVTTRSGKQVLAIQKDSIRVIGKPILAHKPVKLPLGRAKPTAGPAFSIHEDIPNQSTSKNNINTMNKPIAAKPQELPLPTAPKAIDKVLPPSVPNDENTFINKNIIPVSQPTDLLAKTVKVIGISENEKQMNGAPEGALYEVTVCEDDAALPSFSDLNTASQQLQEAVRIYQTTEVWADKFEAVVSFRRCAHHFPASLSDSTLFQAVLAAVLDSITALRSTSAKNALLCLRTLLTFPLAQEVAAAEKISAGTLNRLSVSGPKFLVDFAYSVAEIVAKLYTPAIYIPQASKFLTHRNSEVVRKTGTLIVMNVRQLLDKSPSDLDCALLLSALADCMLKVTNQGVVQMGIAAALQMKRLVGEDAFAVCVSNLGEARAKSVDRLISQAELKAKAS